jgi:hypothetical protein
MVGGAVALVASLIAGQGGGAELEAGATLDLRAGQAPVGLAKNGSNLPSEQNLVMASATPLLGLRWTGTDDELRVLSATRVLWRPVPLLHERPLVLETLSATHLARVSKRTRWQLTLRSTYGEEDYTSLVQQYTSQPQLPQATTAVTANATADVTWLASRLSTLGLSLNAIHRRSLDDMQASSNSGTSVIPTMPTQTSVMATPALRRRLDRRTNLELLVTIADADIRDVQFRLPASDPTAVATWLPAPGATPAGTTIAHVNLLTVQPQIGVVRNLSRGEQLRLFVGGTYAAVLVNPDKNRNWLPLTPVARAELASLHWRDRTSAVRSVLSVGTMWYADPVLGLAVWRGNAEARLDAQLGLRWNAGARAAFITDLNPPIDPASVGGLLIDETVVQVDVPLRYRWSPQTVLEFGGRWAERGPNLRSHDFAWRNREVWAFFTVTGTTYRAPRARQ